jgi:hypothetical protein
MFLFGNHLWKHFLATPLPKRRFSKKFLATNLPVYFKNFFGKLLKPKIFSKTPFAKKCLLAIPV